MSTKPRYDASGAAGRARASDLAPLAAPAPSAAAPFAPVMSRPAGGEYRLLSVHQVHPAPWQPRVVFDRLEELAATIEGNAETQGVGVLEPILVRQLPDGTYQLIDGERRLRSCRLVAEQKPGGDYLIPARVFVVSERVARLMGQTANIERDQPKPFEVALGYKRIQEALVQEASEDDANAEARGRSKPGSVRSMVGIGGHSKTTVGEYLRIADALTSAVLRAAGLVSPDGQPDFAALTQLGQKELLAAAKLEEPAARAAELQARLARRAGAPTRRTTPPPAPPASLEERRSELATRIALTIRTKAPAQMVDPADASALVRQQLAPAILAFVERAEGPVGCGGYFADVGAEHAVLVLPSAVETLTTPQLERLVAELKDLRQRVERAARSRRSRRRRTT